MLRAKKMSLSGWGRAVWRQSLTYRPERWREVQEIVTSGSSSSLIVRGLGRSYGDAALNEGGEVLLLTRLERIIDFDPETGVVECEAGVTFDDLLQIFVPKGYFPPVTPGTKFVTIGGALAADVHGKNHHRDSSFASHVMEFTLLVADGTMVRCSRKKTPNLFRATVGGMGLTGIILAARFRMKRIPSSYLLVDYDRAADLDRVLSRFEEEDCKYEYSVAWMDCLAGGAKVGRSILMRSNTARIDELPKKNRSDASNTHDDPKISVPFDVPQFWLSKALARQFNNCYYHLHSRKEKVVVHYAPFFYPLDASANWNRLYGARGFWQYQAVFDTDMAQRGMTALLDKLRNSSHACLLAVIKAFGAGSGGILSFPKPGYTLSLDIPNRHGSRDLLRQMDEIVQQNGGRVYLAKDACMTKETFQRMYPDAEEFKKIKARFDPHGRFSSSLARRIGLA